MATAGSTASLALLSFKDMLARVCMRSRVCVTFSKSCVCEQASSWYGLGVGACESVVIWMLRALTEELCRIEGPPNDRSDSLSVNGAAERLQSSPLFLRALQQLLSREVQGCTKEPDEALQHKAKGTACFAKGQYEAAAQHFSDALTWLPSDSLPAEVARLHANRALCLLKLADADKSAPAASAAAAAGTATIVPRSCVEADSDSRRCTKIRKLAAAAVEDCTAALGCCEQSLMHKVLFRRAEAHLLLANQAEAEADCQAAVAAAQQCNAPGAAAAVRDCQGLLQEVEARMQQQGVSAPQQHLSTGSAVPRLRVQAHAQDNQQQEPSSGLSLAQINMLLAYQQQEAQNYMQQQSVHAQDQPRLQQGHGELTEAVCLLLKQKLRTAGTQQQCPEGAHQQEQCTAASIQCCYSADKGRYLVATEDIPAGTVVLAEMPLAAVAIKPKKRQQGNTAQQLPAEAKQQTAASSSRCSWCFEPIGISAWPCPACPLALYCSAACRQAACSSGSSHLTATGAAQDSTPLEAGTVGQRARHALSAEHAAGGIECGRPWTRLLPEEAVLASRCLRVRAAAASVTASLSPAQAATAATAHGAYPADSQLMPQQWHEVCQQQQSLHLQVLRASLLDSLVHHPSSACNNNGGGAQQSAKQQRQLQQQQHVEQLALASLVSQIHASAAPVAADSRATEPQRTMSAPTADSPAAVLKCLQQLAANGTAIKPLLSAGPSDRWGLGLYPVTAAVVNHDCDPNCSIRFHGRQLLLICHRDTAAGEELHISYGPQVGLHSTSERQQLLQQQYGFECTCDSCSEGLLEWQAGSPAGAAAPCATRFEHVRKQHAATGASRPVWQREAAAVGLKCCGGGKQLGSTSGSEECVQGPCPGALVPAMPLPAGVVWLQPMAATGHGLCSESGNSSSASNGRACRQLHAQCTVCGWVMPPDMLQQKLLALQAAADDAEAACSMMAGLSEQQAPAQAQQDRHMQQVPQALRLLQKATEARQQHLAAGNQLLGHSHHATAVAAVEAAVLATAHGLPSVDTGSSSAATAGLTNTPARLLGSSLATLQDSLCMQTEEEVCSVLLRLQHTLQVLQESCAACTCASCRSLSGSMEAAEAVLQLPCSCSQHSSVGQSQQSQQEDRQHSAKLRSAQPAADSRAMGHAGPAQAVLQESLSLAFLQFSTSAAVLTHSYPADSLALAVEKAAGCAAGLAFLACNTASRGNAAACAQRDDQAGGTAAHGQEAGAREAARQSGCDGCCRCTTVLGVVACMLQHVSATVDAHLGFMV